MLQCTQCYNIKESALDFLFTSPERFWVVGQCKLLLHNIEYAPVSVKQTS